jgi:carboxypeptidase D
MKPLELILIVFLSAIYWVKGILRFPLYEQRDHDRSDGSPKRARRNHPLNRTLSASTTRQDATTPSIPEAKLQEQRLGLLRGINTLPQVEDHLVSSLPYLNPSDFTTKHYAGHIQASPDASDKKFFYWLFEPDKMISDADTDIPLVIWLNGGPACSSMDGLFLENGPFRLQRKDDGEWTIQVHPYSWHLAPAYVLYVDQPVGTGLSFTKKKQYCHNDLDINLDFHYFLQNFLLMYSDMFLGDLDDHGRYHMKRPLYFTGESYAGHYITSMIDFLIQRSVDTRQDTAPLIYILASGAAIGNGYVNPYYQYSGADIAYAAGLIDAAQKAQLEQDEDLCHEEMDRGDLAADICYSLMDNIVRQSFGKDSKYIVSVYDTQRTELRNVERAFPPGHKDVEMYLGGRRGTDQTVSMLDYKLVLKAIHAEESIDAGQRYEECTDPPYYALSATDGIGVVDELVRILEHESKPRILFYNGMNDIICNHIGNERLLETLPWRNRDSWIMASRYAWGGGGTSPAKPYGYVKEYENLIFMKVLNSSHMVPMDSPALSLEMMKTFLQSHSFRTREQNLDRSLPLSQHCDPCDDCPSSTPIIPPSQQPEPNLNVVTIGSIGFVSAVVICLIIFLLHRKVSIRRAGFTQVTQDHEVI